MADMAHPLEAKRSRFWLGLLLLLSFLLYASTLLNGFVSDDHQQIEGNPYAHSFRYVGKIFTTTVWSFQGHEGRTNYYRPLMTFGYVLSDKLFQTYPFGFHLVNLFCTAWWFGWYSGSLDSFWPTSGSRSLPRCSSRFIRSIPRPWPGSPRLRSYSSLCFSYWPSCCTCGAASPEPNRSLTFWLGPAFCWLCSPRSRRSRCPFWLLSTSISIEQIAKRRVC